MTNISAMQFEGRPTYDAHVGIIVTRRSSRMVFIQIAIELDVFQSVLLLAVQV